MFSVDVGEVGVDRQRKERVAVPPHQVHLDLVADLELFPGHGHDTENKLIIRQDFEKHTLSEKSSGPILRIKFKMVYYRIRYC